MVVNTEVQNGYFVEVPYSHKKTYKYSIYVANRLVKIL